MPAGVSTNRWPATEKAGAVARTRTVKRSVRHPGSRAVPSSSRSTALVRPPAETWIRVGVDAGMRRLTRTVTESSGRRSGSRTWSFAPEPPAIQVVAWSPSTAAIGPSATSAGRPSAVAVTFERRRARPAVVVRRRETVPDNAYSAAYDGVKRRAMVSPSSPGATSASSQGRACRIITHAARSGSRESEMVSSGYRSSGSGSCRKRWAISPGTRTSASPNEPGSCRSRPAAVTRSSAASPNPSW
jgi:hypothetical protein